MRNLAPVALIAFLASCVAPPAYKPLFDAYTEQVALPVDGRTVALDPKFTSPPQQQALGSNQPAPFDGVLLNDTRAARAVQVESSYEELRTIALANQNAAASHEGALEAERQRLLQTVEKLQPIWWDRAEPYVLITAGVLLGISTSVLAEKAVVAGAK